MGRRNSSRRVDIAVPVNGTIVATAPSFAPKRRAAQLFSVLLPEGSLRPGRNSVELYAIVGPTTLRPLTP